MSENYPNVYFFRGDEDHHCRWRLDKNSGKDAESIPQFLTNDQAERVCKSVNEGENHFVCSKCGNAKKKESLACTIDAGKYCIECFYENSHIRNDYNRHSSKNCRRLGDKQ